MCNRITKKELGTQLDTDCVMHASVQYQPRFDSAALLGGAREVIIVHGSQQYRLRLTSQGKLILTK